MDSLNGQSPPKDSNAPRPSVVQLIIKERAALHDAYIPMFVAGGIFIPTSRAYKLGDEVFVLLTLPDDPQRHPVGGKVAWITPERAGGGVRTAGIGVSFPNTSKSHELKAKIEEMIAPLAMSERATQTF